MRNKKRISATPNFNAPSLSIVLAVLIVFFPAMAQAEISGDYEYTNNGDGTCTITDYLGLGSMGGGRDDISMLGEADAGILFLPPDNVIEEFPQFPVTRTRFEMPLFTWPAGTWRAAEVT